MRSEERASRRSSRCAAAARRPRASPTRRAPTTTATARRITANQGSAASRGASSTRAAPRRRTGGRRTVVRSALSGSSVDDPRADLDSDDRREPDDDRRSDAEVAVAALVPGARRQPSGGSRGARCPAPRAGRARARRARARRGCPRRRRTCPASTPAASPSRIARTIGRGAHDASSQTPIAVSSTAKPYVSGARADALLPARCRRVHPPRREARRAPRTRRRPRPCSENTTTPADAVIAIASSDVAVAARSGRPATRISSGTAMMPPPTPKKAEKTPAASPMATRRTDVSYERGQSGRSRRDPRRRRRSLFAGSRADASRRRARRCYIVRADPRLCPSPLCGGYWVALANGARTRCADGVARGALLRRDEQSTEDRRSARDERSRRSARAGATSSRRVRGRRRRSACSSSTAVYAPAGTAPVERRLLPHRRHGHPLHPRAVLLVSARRRSTDRRARTLSGVDLGAARRDSRARSRARRPRCGRRTGCSRAAASREAPTAAASSARSRLYLRAPLPRA